MLVNTSATFQLYKSFIRDLHGVNWENSLCRVFSAVHLPTLLLIKKADFEKALKESRLDNRIGSIVDSLMIRLRRYIMDIYLQCQDPSKDKTTPRIFSPTKNVD